MRKVTEQCEDRGAGAPVSQVSWSRRRDNRHRHQEADPAAMLHLPLLPRKGGFAENFALIRQWCNLGLVYVVQHILYKCWCNQYTSKQRKRRNMPSMTRSLPRRILRATCDDNLWPTASVTWNLQVWPRSYTFLSRPQTHSAYLDCHLCVTWFGKYTKWAENHDNLSPRTRGTYAIVVSWLDWTLTLSFCQRSVSPLLLLSLLIFPLKKTHSS